MIDPLYHSHNPRGQLQILGIVPKTVQMGGPESLNAAKRAFVEFNGAEGCSSMRRGEKDRDSPSSGYCLVPWKGLSLIFRQKLSRQDRQKGDRTLKERLASVLHKGKFTIDRLYDVPDRS